MRRYFSPLIVLLVGAILLAATPAAFAASSDRLPIRVTDVARHDVRHEIKARCFGSVDDSGGGSVECNWTTRDDLAVRGWQLWNIRVRPHHGERNLVAELGADTTAYVDTALEVPGQYLYVVLGLDAAGEIVARSEPASVTLVAASDHVDAMRLRCRAVAARGDSAEIGCTWSSTEAESAVGYVLWRGVAEGDRAVVARTGLDELSYIDTEVAVGHRYLYVVTAVDADGEVVARSRAEHVGLPGSESRPDRVRPVVSRGSIRYR